MSKLEKLGVIEVVSETIVVGDPHRLRPGGRPWPGTGRLTKVASACADRAR